MRDSRVPHLPAPDRLCHTYIHSAADPEKARRIVLNAKMRRTGVCGATETLLADADVAAKILPPILDDLIAAGCEIRATKPSEARQAREGGGGRDWITEYLVRSCR